MKVTAQDGLIVDVEQLEMKNKMIFGIVKFPKAKVELGRYGDLKRTCEVMAEMTCVGWNEKSGEYVMPKE